MKKTALFALSILLSLSFYSAQAQRTSTKKTELESSRRLKETNDSLNRVLGFYLEQYQTEHALHQQKTQELADKNATSSITERSLRLELVQSQLDALKRQNAYDSLKRAKDAQSVGRKKKFPAPLDLRLPQIDYTGCSFDSICAESPLDFLFKLPEQDFTSSDTKSRKMKHEANEIINRLDARATADLFSIYAADMQSMSKEELRKKKPAFDFIMPRLIKRKQYILTHWEEYAELKRDLIQMLELPRTLKDKYILGWY